MGVIVNNTPGPNFRQTAKPTDVSLGNVWYNPETARSSMADGADYWGQAGLGVAGYAAGGIDATVTKTTVIQKVIFSTEAVSSISTGLTASFWNSNSGFNSLVAGYITGDFDAISTAIQKLTFSGDTVSVLVSGMSGGRAVTAGVNSGLAGYLIAGSVPPVIVNYVEKVLFSSDVCNTLSSSVPASQAEGSANVESYSRGYALSGDNDPILISRVVIIQYVQFSDDTCGIIVSTVSQGRIGAAGCKSNTNGYALGGDTAFLSNSTRVDRLVFATEVCSSILSGLTQVTGHLGGNSSAICGYAMGGRDNSGTTLTNVQRITFSNESVASITSGLSVARSMPCGFENLS